MNLLNPYESYLCFHALWTHHRNLRLPRTELLAAQRTKFRRLVHFVRERSPYYRDVIAGRGLDPDRCEPTDFPVLTKRDVIRHFDDIVTDRRLTSDRVAEFLARSASPLALLDDRYHVLHTSGTSGTMGMYVFSKEAWIRATTQILRAVPFGLRRRVAFMAATQGILQA